MSAEFGNGRSSVSASSQCIYSNDDGTWSRTNSTDHLVRLENMQEYPPLVRVLREYGVRTIIDAGANDGLSTRIFAQGLPSATVVALEPELGNYAMLLRNTRGLNNVVSLRAALWNASTDLHIPTHLNSQASWGFRVKSGGSGAAGVKHDSSLPGITLPRLLDSLCVQTLDFFKMDIEGAERTVLVPGSETWLRRVNYLYIEAHAWAPNPDGTSAVATSVRALLSADMTVVTNLNLKMNTWMPSMPPGREYIFLACHRNVKASICRHMCRQWRNGSKLTCDYVRSERETMSESRRTI